MPQVRHVYGEGPATLGWRRKAHAKRTVNMLTMLVTLEVSQLLMFALKLARSLKRANMLVMPETSQSAMGPYLVVAAAALFSYSSTAVLRLTSYANTLLSRRRRWFGGPGVLARIADSHCGEPSACGEHTPGCSTSATLLATFGLVTRVVTPLVM